MATDTWNVQIYLNSGWRDVTANVRGINVQYGRQRVLDSFRAGKLRLSLDNTGNVYGPLAGGTYGDAQWINAEIRVSVNINSASNNTPIFRGTIEDVDTLYPNSRDSTVIVKAFDGLAKLAKTEIAGESFSAEVGSTRFTNVLNLASVAYPAQPGSPDASNPNERNVETSSITMQSESVSQVMTSTYLERLAQSEDGAVFCAHGSPGGAAVGAADKGNVLTYSKRDSAGTASGLTFGAGAGTASTEPKFTNIATSYGNELLYTRGVYQRTGGAIQTYDENVIGQPAYGIRTIVRQNLMNANDSDVESAMKNFVALHSTPALRISAVECKPRAMTDAQAEKVAKLTIFDSIRAQFQPAGAGSAMLQVLRVESITHEVTPRDWTMRIGTSGSGDTVFLIIDSADFGILNSNKIAP